MGWKPMLLGLQAGPPWPDICLVCWSMLKKNKQRTGRIWATLFSARIGKRNQSPNFLVFDFMFIKGNLVFNFIANVYHFEPGTCLPCISPVLLYPELLVLSLFKPCLRISSHIKGHGPHPLSPRAAVGELSHFSPSGCFFQG